MNGAGVVQFAAAGYLLVGLLFALAFVTVGVSRFDPAARGTSVAFRLLILSGCVTLWPLLAAKWVRNRS
jgi:hypothetical protein